MIVFKLWTRPKRRNEVFQCRFLHEHFLVIVIRTRNRGCTVPRLAAKMSRSQGNVVPMIMPYRYSIANSSLGVQPPQLCPKSLLRQLLLSPAGGRQCGEL